MVTNDCSEKSETLRNQARGDDMEIIDSNGKKTILKDTEQVNPIHKIGVKSMFRTEDGKVKAGCWLILLTVFVIAAVIGVIMGVTASKSPSTQPSVYKRKCNYQIGLSFEHECDTLPPNYEDNFEPALIDYHEYVFAKENQTLHNLSVTIFDYKPSVCIETPATRRHNLSGGNSHRELFGLSRKSNMTYNLFGSSFGPCPDQALPFVSIPNRRYLQQYNSLKRQELQNKHDAFPDILPFFRKFQEIFKNIVELNVTDAKTNIAGTQKIDCSKTTGACSSESGICCGQDDCHCNNPTDFLTCFPSYFPSSYPTNFPSIHPTNSPSSYPTKFPTGYPSKFPSSYPTRFPTKYPSKFPSSHPTKFPTSNPTNSPSIYPTEFPTSYPTNSPSSYPTNFPSSNPTISGHPTNFPSSHPTNILTQTNFPSKSPTIFPTHLIPVWVQKGSDIDPSSFSDHSRRSGNSVSLSSDGLTVAITDFGRVRVHEYLNGYWVQKGSEIYDDDDPLWWGASVSLSSDGLTVAIGAGYYDGINGTQSGQVKVYKYSDTFWLQKGSDINGESFGDWSGYSVSLSSDGHTVAVGAIRNDGMNDSNGFNSGHVRVYRYFEDSWVQTGTDIDGESLGDESGCSVSLSSDGITVAIGARKNDGINGVDSGHVRVYGYLDGSWEQKGSDIDGESFDDWSGDSVSLSSDGMTVAIGAFRNVGINGIRSGHVRVYEYLDGSWVQKGSDIDGEAAFDHSGISASLSSDGHTVAIGAFFSDGINGTDSGHVRVYGYLNGSWVQIGTDIDGEAVDDEFGKSVSLSSDGLTVAIGGPGNDGNGTNSGHVRVYQLVHVGFDH